VPALPFPLRRLGLLVRGAATDRNNPPFERLSAIEDPEQFVWEILPHAARSFAPSIVLLPEREARATAIGYLYARMLDTYEDLSPSPAAAREAIGGFARRFDVDPPGPAPALPATNTADPRDLAHLLLVRRHVLVDQLFVSLDSETRKRITVLIDDMASGMRRYSTVFENQGGVLESNEQVIEYCHEVIGLPALFTIETILGHVPEDHFGDALEVSELVQLANITRDIEKDLKRGVAYHPGLRPFLGSDGSGRAQDAVTNARLDLMRLATRRAPSFRRLIDASQLPRLSPARAAAVMMMLFTDRHYRRCAADVGLPTWSGPRRVLTMVLASVPAALSPKWADRILQRVETDLLATA
jgi:phytoene/squalene synthetase